MWIPTGKIEEFVHALYQHVRHCVFEIFCFVMDFVPCIVQCLYQERFKQSVTAHHIQCILSTPTGELHCSVRCV
ncbi:Uncharacterised protein [Corynebacterium striatum]|nr:hypothetical protein AZH45_06775 [Corynebacterium striatum]STD38413.1 Uncharacterised protein [Corynebacterium striatum]